MSPFTSLSNDLLLYLSSYIGRKDCESLRLTCNVFADIFALRVLRFIRIDVQRLDSGAEKPALDILKWMAGGNSVHKGRVDAVRTLSVTSLSYANGMTASSDECREEAAEERTKIQEKEIMGVLELALLSLFKVQTFIWQPQQKDPPSSHEIVAKTVSSYPQLKRLEINMTYLTSPVLAHFKNLESIDYGVWCPHGVDPVPDIAVEAFSQTVAQSPKLTSFHFNPVWGKEHDLNRIFQRCHDTGIILPLHELVLFCSIPTLSLLPHLRHLSRLNILATSTFGTTPEERQVLFQRLWHGLTHDGVRLQHIRVDRVPDALVDYLKSYKGLKTFEFHNHDRQNDEITANVYLTSGRFHHEALVNHISTLESLDIDLEYEDQWSFHRDYAPAISQCKNLKFLGVGFGYGQLGGLGNADPLESDKPCLHVFLDAVATGCTLLKDLTIHNPLPDRSTADSPYSGHMEHFQIKGMWEITQHKLLKWSAAESSNIQSLPNIDLAGYDLLFHYVPAATAAGVVKYSKQKKD